MNNVQRKVLSSWQRLWVAFGPVFWALLLIAAVFLVTFNIVSSPRDTGQASPAASLPAVPLSSSAEPSEKFDPALGQAARANAFIDKSTPSKQLPIEALPVEVPK